MALKTVPLKDRTHECLKKIQELLYQKYHMTMSLQDIISVMMPKTPEEGVEKIINTISKK